MAARSSILAWRIPWTAAWRAAVHGVAKSWTRLKLLSTAHTAHTHLRTLFFPQKVMYFFRLAVLGLCYCQAASLAAESGGCSQAMVHRLLTAVVPPVAGHRL